jgi:membrane protein YdbS with pleckstrin-like domain
MHELLKRLVLRLLRVPPEPQPPAGSPGSARVFRASKNFYYYNLFRWGLKQIGAIVGILFLMSIRFGADAGSEFPWKSIPLLAPVEKVIAELEEKIEDDEEEDDTTVSGIARVLTSDWFFYLETFGIIVLVLQMPVTYTMVRLDYEMRWYIVTDRSIRIREGVTSVREMTMTFANVQNLAIEQGPVQRLLTISDLRVRTAGGGGGEHSDEEIEKLAGSLHIGYLRGVDNAKEIRDSILGRLRQLKDSGLGDPDDRAVAVRDPAATSRTSPTTLAAARSLLTEARNLRGVLR